MLTAGDMPDLGNDVSALFFGGISLASEPCADAYADLLSRAAAQRVVMLDPNIRPKFIQDVETFRARLLGMIARADIVKVSDEDLDWILPQPGSMTEKAQMLCGMGPDLVLLTRGAGGASGYLAKGCEVTVNAPAVTIVDTVGAGDTFNAGVLAQLSQLGRLTKQDIAGLDLPALESVVQMGVRAAAVTVSRAGANPPWASELSGPDPEM